MKIIRADASSYEAVRGFYHSLIDEMKSADRIVTWVKDVYPAPEFLKESAERRELYLGIEDGQIAAAMVLNCDANEGYRDASWQVDACEGEAMVIHALGVHPRFGGRGFGAEMTRYAIDVARNAGMKAIRLDVLKGNEPARRIYVSCGFEPIGWVQMYYENTGLADFELFECAL